MSTWWGTIDRLPKSQQNTVLRTIAALYDDTIDTELTLNDLRKSDLAPEQISVILREHVLEGDRIVSSETQLSRVVAATAIESVSTWLRGLATLVMSDRAAYVVAGPFGYVLASQSTARTVRDRVGSDTAAETDLVNQQLLRALRRFGFSADESGYIEARIGAGSPFIAITAADVDSLRTAHRIFSKRAAVYLGLARTDPQIESIVQHLAEMGPLPRSASVLVADTASNLVRADELPTPPSNLKDLRNRPVETRDGVVFGTIRDALYRRPRNGDSPDLRYVVVQCRRFRGLRTWTVAIPFSAIALSDSVARLDLDSAQLRQVPHFVASRPMSSQEEQAIDVAFGLPAQAPTPPRQEDERPVHDNDAH